MLVDENGEFMTQRKYPKLATIKIKILDNKLYLSSLNNKNFELIPNLNNQQIFVKIWKDTTIAIDQGDEIANWFQTVLNINFSCRLVQQSDQFIRAINNKYTDKTEPVSFADGFPYLLTNTGSLDELNKRLKDKYNEDLLTVNMERFRPNIVVETNAPFIEDSWSKIIIDNVTFKVAKPCSRCIVITTDQLTGKQDNKQEPLLTLNEFRHTPEGIMFGQNLIAVNEGTIEINSYLKNN